MTSGSREENCACTHKFCSILFSILESLEILITFAHTNDSLRVGYLSTLCHSRDTCSKKSVLSWLEDQPSPRFLKILHSSIFSDPYSPILSTSFLRRHTKKHSATSFLFSSIREIYEDFHELLVIDLLYNQYVFIHGQYLPWLPQRWGNSNCIGQFPRQKLVHFFKLAVSLLLKVM